MMITVNHTIPGPVIRTTLFQTVVITVINELGDDVSTVHWHGMNQRSTNYCDGVVGLTQCKINFNPPGQPKKNLGIMTYKFKFGRCGTFWYHSHINDQFTDGLYGPLIVMDNAPIVAAYKAVNLNYMYETTLTIADWYDLPGPAYLEQYLSPESDGNEPQPDAIVVNNTFSGKLVYNVGRQDKVRIRLINAAAFSMYSFSVDGMPVQAIELDATPIKPLNLSHVTLNAGQRVSVVLDFSLLDTSLRGYNSIYFRVKAMPEMYPTYNASAPNFGLYGQTYQNATYPGDPFELVWTGKFVFTDGLGTSYPASSEPVSKYPAPADTNLQQASLLIPYPAAAPDLQVYFEIVFQADAMGVNRAYINGETHLNTTLSAYRPVLYDYLAPGGGPLTYKALNVKRGASITGNANNPFIIPFNRTFDFFFNNTDGGEHPLHIHGHRFWVLGTSDYPNVSPNSAIMRDVVSVPAQGWARIRVIGDNPGVWALHCHIDWHVDVGFFAFFIVAPEKLNDGSIVVPPDHIATCNQWLPPTAIPTATPTVKPTAKPTTKPSRRPSLRPSAPTLTPSVMPSAPSASPSVKPSVNPSINPSIKPSLNPSIKPSGIPLIKPSVKPSVTPSLKPLGAPVVKPSVQPSIKPR